LKSADEFLDQLGDRIYLDSSGYEGDPNVYRLAIETFSAEQLMLGTDFPYETRTGEEFQNVIAGVEAAAEPADVDGILGRNALDLLVNVD
jgi:predicted TIM-barrel fold metal-dependent hydrolase